MGSMNISILKDTESDHDVKLSFRCWEIEGGRRTEKTMSIFSSAAQAKAISAAALSVWEEETMVQQHILRITSHRRNKVPPIPNSEHTRRKLYYGLVVKTRWMRTCFHNAQSLFISF